jgi:tetratricopeptide (TPR) repeat protein
MASGETLERAIEAARAGRREEARGLLIEIVEADPRNEKAWMWLAGVVDSLDDRIIACENVLTINPANEKVRTYLTKLQRQQNSSVDRKNISDAAGLLNEAKAYAQRNEIKAALQLARQALEKNYASEDTWLFIGRISPNIDEQIAALEKAYELNPSNTETASTLKQLRYRKSNPTSAATHLEQLGKFEEALAVYQELAAKAKDSREFDHIYKQIIRIEALQKEKIRYVAPRSSITRLTFSWPLVYLSLALIQMGLNPFAHPAFYLWIALPFVVLGSFLLSLAEVRSRHVVWQTLFDEHGDGSTFARLVTAAVGWFLILVPHIMIILDSLNRLRVFKIPPMPL